MLSNKTDLTSLCYPHSGLVKKNSKSPLVALGVHLKQQSTGECKNVYNFNIAFLIWSLNSCIIDKRIYQSKMQIIIYEKNNKEKQSWQNIADNINGKPHRNQQQQQ